MADIVTIPFVDLRAQYSVLREEMREAIDGVLAAGRYILGPNVSAFEREFADYVGAPHAIGCGNGGDALEMVMRLWGARAGDEIIVPANSWIATASAATPRASTATNPAAIRPRFPIRSPSAAERLSSAAAGLSE